MNNNIKLFFSILALLIVGGTLYFLYNSYTPVEKVIPTETAIAEKEPLNTSTSTSRPILKSISKEEYLRYASLLPKTEPVVEHTECNETHNSYLGLQCEEKYKLSKYSSVVRLDENCLKITLTDKTTSKLCDKNKEEDNSGVVLYTFSGYVPNLGHFFDASYYEGGGVLLINENTGEEMNIFGKPILSPSGNKFLSVGLDLGEAGFNPNGFQIWQKQGDSYSKKVEHYIDNQDDYNIFGIVDPVWVNENSFYFIKRLSTYDYNTGKFKSSDDYAAYSF